MAEAFLVAAVRTPIGRHRGALADVRADDLLAHAYSAALTRAGVEAEAVDEVFAGCANQAGEDNRNVARMAWLIAGHPYETPCATVNRLCASGLEAIVQAARAVRLGDAKVVMAAGVESMTRAPLVVGKAAAAWGGGNREMFDTSLGWRFPNPRLAARFPLEQMGETAENLAERFGIARADQDAWALRSHQRAVSASKDGSFADELVAVEVPDKIGTRRVEVDEGPRVDTSLEQLGKLKPAFRQGGTVTAGNSSTLNDGAAAAVVMSGDEVARRKLTPLARIVGYASAGVDPRIMGVGPVPATQRALERAGLSVGDVDLVEVNEAFAAQVLTVVRELRLDPERVNVHGGAIALGHPLGCSGVRIVATLAHALKRRQARAGLATLCVGVGQGETLVLRRD